jgi:hypothetical protein
MTENSHVLITDWFTVLYLSLSDQAQILYPSPIHASVQLCKEISVARLGPMRFKGFFCTPYNWYMLYHRLDTSVPR